MSNLVTLDAVTLAYGLEPLLDHAKLTIQSGERICLIGRNGAGKSSLLKILEGSIAPDSGSVWRQPNSRIARVAQELPQDRNLTVYEYVAEGLSETGKLLTAYHQLTADLAQDHSEEVLQNLETLQQKIDHAEGWHFERNINEALNQLALNPEQLISELSGGWQRRAALARALVIAPELLLLDEPTNHLDISAIQWLEEYLLSTNMTVLFITHDRALLQRLATRIIELDRGQLTSWPGDYDNFLRRKEEMLHAEAKQHAEFDKVLAQEERWIRQGIKARRTRNEGRVRALEALRRVRAQRRVVQGKANLNISDADKSGQIVIEAKNISQQFNDKALIKDFSTTIMRGDKIGLIGPNGVGKSTLINILLGQLQPTQGTVKLGTQLQIAYSDQLRLGLNNEKSVIDNVAGGRQFIDINGKQKHVISYLGDFLFTPQRAQTPVKALSGGECNRLSLAILFSNPFNLLVMDEPTNDLDIETLELLEELLMQYQGTLLLVSHDRKFLDNVVTSTLVFEGDGQIDEYFGNYQDWLRQRKTVSKNSAVDQIAKARVVSKPEQQQQTTSKSKTKLSYEEQKELKNLPQKIESLDAKQQALHMLMADPDFYQHDAEWIAGKVGELASISAALEQAYQRWDALERLSK